MRSTTRSIATLVFTGLFVAACGAAGAAPTTPPVTQPPATATPAAPTPLAAPTATVLPATDAKGPEHFSGTASLVGLIHDYTSTRVGDVVQMRGGIASLKITTNDARMTGTLTQPFSVDAYDSVGPEWGTIEVKNAAGSWTGTFTAAVWDYGDSIAFACWLVGSGAYKEYTAYLMQIKYSGHDAIVEGIIYPGPAPKL